MRCPLVTTLCVPSLTPPSRVDYQSSAKMPTGHWLGSWMQSNCSPTGEQSHIRGRVLGFEVYGQCLHRHLTQPLLPSRGVLQHQRRSETSHRGGRQIQTGCPMPVWPRQNHAESGRLLISCPLLTNRARLENYSFLDRLPLQLSCSSGPVHTMETIAITHRRA